MGYENDPYMDEDGEPLMDPDTQSDREASPEPAFPIDDGEDEGDWRRGRSPTPVLGEASEDKGGKPRKRLVKKGDRESSPMQRLVDEGLDDWDDEEQPSSSKKNLKAAAAESFKGGKGEKKEKRKSSSGSKRDRISSSGKGGSGGLRGKGDDEEIQEMWNTIAGGDSEDDQVGVKTMDDDNFIDDSGLDPADRFGSDNDGSPRHAPQAEEGEEDDEIEKLFKGGKKRKKNEKSPAEIAMIVENYMAEFEVTAEEDAEFNRQNKPAINKLRKLPMLIDILSKKMLQQEFLDHGILTVLKNWLEPLPDGSLPNMNIRAAILRILSDYPIDLEQYDRREQLKKSGLGKVIMFLSKSDEETTSNRKLAKELVDKWSRPIFNKSTRFEDMRSYDDERTPYRRPSSQKRASRTLESQDDDLDLAEFSQGKKAGQPARQHASRPEASPLDFVVRPQSKVDPEEVRARAKQVVQDPRRLKMNKKLQQLKTPKRQLQASKLSVEGRGMIKYL